MTSSNAHQVPPIICEGETCWRIAHADRAAVLVDADAYFRALRAAIIDAERLIVVVAWELHTRVDLMPGEAPDDGWPTEFGPLIRAAVRRKPDLHVYLLMWDFAVIYAFERELVPVFKLPWKAHPRIHLITDDAHPPGGSQHQKVVVVDDCLAFCGGLDVTSGRWDVPEHRAIEPRRRTPDGRPYGPFHDVQMMVDGDAARSLGDLARDRWIRAGGRSIPSADISTTIWPGFVEVAFRDVGIGIARTEPAYGGRTGVREVEALYLASLATARRAVYIENQYFTSAVIGAAMERSLSAPDGPEIVMVLPCRNTGWLEESTMGVGRSRLLQHIRKADRYGRFAVFNCELAGVGRNDVKVHSKIMVVDDRLVRVGSSNLSNRSMGLDTECDLAIEAGDRPDVAAGILRFRNRLLAEHLDCTEHDVAGALARTGSLVGAIKELAHGPRRLEPFVDLVPDLLNRFAPGTDVVDPDHPVAPEALATRLLAPEEYEMAESTSAGAAGLQWRWLIRPGLLLAIVAVLAIAWAFTPLRQVANVGALLQWASGWSASALAPVYIILAFILGGLIAFPVTVLISLTGALFPPLWGFLYAMIGIVLSAALLFFIGFLLGRDAVRRLGSKTLTRLSERIGERGVVSVAIIRLVPIAPFSLVNLVAGATHIRFRDFILGTLLGLGPGTMALILLGDRLAAVLRHPTLVSVSLLLGAIIILVAVAFAADRWVYRRRDRERKE